MHGWIYKDIFLGCCQEPTLALTVGLLTFSASLHVIPCGCENTNANAWAMRRFDCANGCCNPNCLSCTIKISINQSINQAKTLHPVWAFVVAMDLESFLRSVVPRPSPGPCLHSIACTYSIKTDHLSLSRCVTHLSSGSGSNSQNGWRQRLVSAQSSDSSKENILTKVILNRHPPPSPMHPNAFCLLMPDDLSATDSLWSQQQKSWGLTPSCSDMTRLKMFRAADAKAFKKRAEGWTLALL